MIQPIPNLAHSYCQHHSPVALDVWLLMCVTGVAMTELVVVVVEGTSDKRKEDVKSIKKKHCN